MALLIFAPIPWSRMHLKDHSSWQCVVGILMGASVQGLWMLLLPWTWRADTSTRHFFIDEVSHALREKNERRSFLRQASDDVRLPRTYQDTENIDETASLISSCYRIPASTIAWVLIDIRKLVKSWIWNWIFPHISHVQFYFFAVLMPVHQTKRLKFLKIFAPVLCAPVLNQIAILQFVMRE